MLSPISAGYGTGVVESERTEYQSPHNLPCGKFFFFLSRTFVPLPDHIEIYRPFTEDWSVDCVELILQQKQTVSTDIVLPVTVSPCAWATADATLRGIEKNSG